jgi:hypothetical protein
MTAILFEPVTKIKKKISKRRRPEELIQPSGWGLKEYHNKQTQTTDGSIHSQPLPKQYILNAETASFDIAWTELSFMHLHQPTVQVDSFLVIGPKSSFEQTASKINQSVSHKPKFPEKSKVATPAESIAFHSKWASLAKESATKNPMSFASKIKVILKGQSDSLRRLSDRIVADSHQRLNEKIKTSVDAATLKADSIQAIALQSDDAKQFSAILDDLRGGIERPTSEAINAVLEIQCLPIPEVLKNETLLNLLDFIKKHRATNSQQILVAVGAALRKVLLNLPASDIGLAAELMKSEGSLVVPIGVELEIAKMVVQRVIEDPSINASLLPELADALLSNAKLYSTPKMVNREFYNATALNSVLACVLMRSPESQLLSNQILNDSPNWFSRLCSNRLKRIRTELLSQDDSNSRELAKHLASLALVTDDQKSQGEIAS